MGGCPLFEVSIIRGSTVDTKRLETITVNGLTENANVRYPDEIVLRGSVGSDHVVDFRVHPNRCFACRTIISGHNSPTLRTQ